MLRRRKKAASRAVSTVLAALMLFSMNAQTIAYASAQDAAWEDGLMFDGDYEITKNADGSITVFNPGTDTEPENTEGGEENEIGTEKPGGGDDEDTPGDGDSDEDPDNPGGEEPENPEGPGEGGGEDDPDDPDNPGGGDDGDDPDDPDNPGGGDDGEDPENPDNPGEGDGEEDPEEPIEEPEEPEEEHICEADAPEFGDTSLTGRTNAAKLTFQITRYYGEQVGIMLEEEIAAADIADEEGSWSYNLPEALYWGDRILISFYAADGEAIDTIEHEIEVLWMIHPINAGDLTISGTTMPGGKVYLYVSGWSNDFAMEEVIEAETNFDGQTEILGVSTRAGNDLIASLEGVIETVIKFDGEIFADEEGNWQADLEIPVFFGDEITVTFYDGELVLEAISPSVEGLELELMDVRPAYENDARVVWQSYHLAGAINTISKGRALTKYEFPRGNNWGGNVKYYPENDYEYYDYNNYRAISGMSAWPGYEDELYEIYVNAYNQAVNPNVFGMGNEWANEVSIFADQPETYNLRIERDVHIRLVSNEVSSVHSAGSPQSFTYISMHDYAFSERKDYGKNDSAYLFVIGSPGKPANVVLELWNVTLSGTWNNPTGIKIEAGSSLTLLGAGYQFYEGNSTYNVIPTLTNSWETTNGMATGRITREVSVPFYAQSIIEQALRRISGQNYGGAVYVGQNATLDARYIGFEDNVALYMGGSIFGAAGSTIMVDNCHFINQRLYAVPRIKVKEPKYPFEAYQVGKSKDIVYEMMDRDGSGRGINFTAQWYKEAYNAQWGGGIAANRPKSVTITNTRFEDLVATDNGGAIYIWGDNAGTQIEMNNVSFYHNGGGYRDKNTVPGGAVMLHGNVTGEIKNSYFNSRNSEAEVKQRASIEWQYDNYVHWQNIAYELRKVGDNAAANILLQATKTEAVAQTGFGGGLYLQRVSDNTGKYAPAIDLTRTTFEYFSPMKHSLFSGGAVFVNMDASINISESTFQHNTASGFGGAVYGQRGTDDPDKYLNISGSTFRDNEAEEGGAVYIAERAHSIEGNTFEENRGTYFYDDPESTSGSPGGGGAVSILTSDVFPAVIGGGNTFRKNYSQYGAAVLAKGSDGVGSQITVGSENVFEENTGSYGAAVLGYTQDVTIKGGNTFTGNSVTVDGGAIRPWSVQTVTIESGNTFTGNHADSQGGAIYIGSVNEAKIGATGDYPERTVFENNTSGEHGGAIYLGNARANQPGLQIMNADFIGNHSVNGGAVYTQYSTEGLIGMVKIEESVFNRNTADDRGGALFLQGTRNAGSFTDYTAFDADTPIHRILGTKLTHNTAGDGGAIFMGTQAVALIDDSYLMSNRATGEFAGASAGTGNGGAVYLNASNAAGNYARLKITNSQMAGNQAALDGGGVYIARASDWTNKAAALEVYDKLYIDAMQFHGNRASRSIRWDETKYSDFKNKHDSQMNNIAEYSLDPETIPFTNGYNNYDVNYTAAPNLEITKEFQKLIRETGGEITDPQVIADEGARIGDTIEYLVTVHNPAQTAMGEIVLRDEIPQETGAKLLQETGDIAVSAGGYEPITNGWVWTLDSLGAGNTETLTMRVVLGESAGPIFYNKVTVNENDDLPGYEVYAPELSLISSKRAFFLDGTQVDRPLTTNDVFEYRIYYQNNLVLTRERNYLIDRTNGQWQEITSPEEDYDFSIPVQQLRNNVTTILTDTLSEGVKLVETLGFTDNGGTSYHWEKVDGKENTYQIEFITNYGNKDGDGANAQKENMPYARMQVRLTQNAVNALYDATGTLNGDLLNEGTAGFFTQSGQRLMLDPFDLTNTFEGSLLPAPIKKVTGIAKDLDNPPEGYQNRTSASIGEEIEYAVTFKNMLGNNITDVILTDEVSVQNGLAYLSCSGSGAASPNAAPSAAADGTITWDIGTMAPDEEAVLVIRARVLESAFSAKQVENSASVTYNRYVPEDPAAPISETFVSEPRVTPIGSVKIAHRYDSTLHNAGDNMLENRQVTAGTDDNLDAGGLARFEIHYRNTASETLDVRIQDKLPEGVTYKEAGCSDTDGEVEYDNVDTVTWTIPGVSAAEEGCVWVIAELAPDIDANQQTLLNTAEIRYYKPGGNPDDPEDVINTETPESESDLGEPGTYKLRVDAQGNPATEPVKTDGTVYDYRVYYRNDTGSDVQVTIKELYTPDGAMTIAGHADGEHLDADGADTGKTPTWENDANGTASIARIANVGAGHHGYVVFRVSFDKNTGPAAGNTATVQYGDGAPEKPVTSTDPVYSHKSAPGIAEYDGGGNLITGSYTKADTANLSVGDEVYYEIHYTNLDSGSRSMDSVTIRDRVPEGMDLVWAMDELADGTAAEVTYYDAYDRETEKPAQDGEIAQWLSTVRMVQWKIAPAGGIPHGRGNTVALILKVTGTPVSGKIINQAEITYYKNPTEGDPGGNVDDPSDEKDLEVEHDVESWSSKTVSGGSIRPGEQATYEIAYENKFAAAVDVIIEDMLPEGISFVSTASPAAEYVLLDGSGEITTQTELARGIRWTIENVSETAGQNTGSVLLTIAVDRNPPDDVIRNQAVVIYKDRTTGITIHTDRPSDEKPVGNMKQLKKVRYAPNTQDGADANPWNNIADVSDPRRTVRVGQDLLYVLRFTHEETTPRQAMIVDELEDSLTFKGAFIREEGNGGREVFSPIGTQASVSTPYYTQNGNELRFRFDYDLAAGEYAEVYVWVQVTDAGEHAVKNTAKVFFSVDNDSPGAAPDDESESENPIVSHKIIPSGTGMGGAPVGVGGEDVSYRVYYTNTTGETMQRAEVTDHIPQGMQFVSTSRGSSSGTAETVLIKADGSETSDLTDLENAVAVKWTIKDTVAAGSGGYVDFVFATKDEVPPNGRYVNRAAVDFFETEDGTIPADPGEDTEDKEDDLTVENPNGSAKYVKSGSAGESGRGIALYDEVEYIIQYVNTSADRTRHATITDTVPAGMELVSYGDGQLDETARTVTWERKDIAPLGYGTVSIKLKVTSEAISASDGVIANKAAISWEDATDPSIVIPDDELDPVENPVVGKYVGSDSQVGQAGAALKIGDRVTYSIKAVSPYRKNPATLVVTENIPAGMRLVENGYTTALPGDAPQGIDFTVRQEGRQIIWTIGNIPKEYALVLKAEMEVTSEAVIAAVNGKISNKADMQWKSDIDENDPEYEPGPDDSTVETENPVGSYKKVSGQSTAGIDGASLNIGDHVSYEIGWNDPESGNSALTLEKVEIRDRIPAGMTLTAAGGADGKRYTFNAASGAFEDAAGAQAAGLAYTQGTVVWTIEGSPKAAGSVTIDMLVNENAGAAVTNRANIRYTHDDGNGGRPVTEDPLNPEVTNPVGSFKKVAGDSANGIDGKALAVGDTVTYEIGWSNPEKDETVTAIHIKDEIAESLQLIGAFESDENYYAFQNGAFQDLSGTLSELDYTEGTLS